MAFNRLRHISIEDDIPFEYNNDVMRQCFNRGGDAAFGQYAVQDTGDGCAAWFPKERKWKNGEWCPGSSEVNWKNHIEEDGLVIIMELNDGENPKDSSDAEPQEVAHGTPLYTFWKADTKAPYKYVGTYMVDVNASKPRHQVFRRLDTEIDLSPWYDQINFAYLQNNDQGKAVFKKIYIDRNYAKQKKHVDAFLQQINDYREREIQYLSTLRYVQENYSLPKLNRLNEDGFLKYVSELQHILDTTFGESETTIIQRMESMTFPNSALLIVDIINTQDHNKEIRKNKLGQYITGRIMAIYDPRYYIYSLPEEIVDYYLMNLKVQIPQNADLTEKHCLLYFWKQCNEEMDDWSPFIFTCFLESVFGNPYKKAPEEVGFQTIGENGFSSMEPLINQKRLQQAMKWFLYYSITQKHDSNIHFSEGWIRTEEGYKEEIFANAHKALDYASWDVEMIGSGIILDCVIDAFNAKDNHGFNNIVDYHSVTWFKNKAEEDIHTAESILYRMYKDEVPAEAFDEACSFWGKRYPELSYLLFARDKNEYLPVKTSHHVKRFKMLDIDTACLNQCSWENYKAYIQIHEEVRQQMEDYYGMPASLLDAHSFIWMLHLSNGDFSCNKLPEFEAIGGNQNPYESTVIKGEKEGRIVERYVTKYERNPKNRAAAIKIHGYRCAVCGFNFAEVYGELGRDFIEVHHVKPLYSLTEEVTINPETDLICLCANCHRMIHKKRGAIMTVEELKQSLQMKPFLRDINVSIQ